MHVCICNKNDTCKKILMQFISVSKQCTKQISLG